MGTRDPRIDAYIARARPFARPILTQLRAVVHAACPDVEETLKWSSPAFMYKGMLCGMAAFKEHATFGFWKHALILKKADDKWNDAMGSFGRLTSVKDLPSSAALTAHVRKAMALNDAGVPAPHLVKRAKRKPLPVPGDLRAALAKNTKARTTFEGFSPSNRRDYVEWIVEAKGAETRARRLATAIEWMADGKIRNWKYAR
ncbi:MAG TPA: YdeI/OmpD-associated family protein [Gemmatimonadaceae bacterium]|nr:YdeI/OmpD-associated family protein [Gemmatimonadaceae bacterium]